MDNFIFDERIKENWNIDKTLAFRLHNKDSKALEEFYTLNEKHLRCLGYCVARESRLITFNDVVNGVIVDIFNYDFSDLKKFSNCLTRTFKQVKSLYSKVSLVYKNLVSLDKLMEDNFNDKSSDLGCVYIDNSEELRENELRVVEFLKAQIKLSSRQKDDLLCTSFNIRFYEGAFNYYVNAFRVWV